MKTWWIAGNLAESDTSQPFEGAELAIEIAAFTKALQYLSAAHSTIHSEYCGRTHHMQCLIVQAQITELKSDLQPKEVK